MALVVCGNRDLFTFSMRFFPTFLMMIPQHDDTLSDKNLVRQNSKDFVPFYQKKKILALKHFLFWTLYF